MINGKLLFKDNFASLTKKINQAVIVRLSNLKLAPIEEAFRQRFQQVVRASDTWQSLETPGENNLSADFGFINPTAKLEPIMSAWLSTIQASGTLITRPRSFKYSIRIVGSSANFSDVLPLDAATVLNKGERLPWLEWLVIRQDDEVIQGYKIERGNYPQSRSGFAIMTPDPLSVFSVQEQHRGRIGNNFVTRALLTLSQDRSLNNFIVNSIKTALKRSR